MLINKLIDNLLGEIESGCATSREEGVGVGVSVQVKCDNFLW